MHFHPCFSRRHFLAQQGIAGTTLAIASLLNHKAIAEPPKPDLTRRTMDLLPKAPHYPAQAKAMISMFMQGGPSHVDLFDRKLELEKRNGEKYEGELKYDNAAESSAKIWAGPWKWERYGQCGMELSELVPHMGSIADDMTLIRSMNTGVNNHGQSIYALHHGRITAGRPVLGSWLTYGIGSESQRLPAFVVLTDPGGLPVLGTDCWSNGWLPSIYQGTVIRPQEPRIRNLNPPPHLAGKPQKAYLQMLQKINAEHLQGHPNETDLEARIATYALAEAMQSAASEALDIGQETEATHTMYGLDQEATREYGTRCLIARRLVERGVRFVQIYTSTQQWDHHGNIEKALPASCLKTDQPSAALVKDLKQRGLLDSTLVHWGGEMGRLPVIQNEKNVGRDHNTYGFSSWLAGGGIRSGCVHGATDDFGYKAISDIVHHYDYHATLLYLFGLDPAKLSFPRPGAVGTLLDGQPGQVVRGILNQPPAST
ncbi:MAG: DUF1501 domain-containing protein [Planctomycetota bacterium]